MDSHRDSDAVTRKSPESPLASPLRGEWRAWGDYLRRFHLDGLAAWLLEAGRPLALVSAQFLYMGRPFLGAGAARLARLLESESEAAEFMDYLGSEGAGNSGGLQGGT